MPQTRRQIKNAEMEAILGSFFSSPKFAVAGASSSPAKYGHQVFAWYLNHSLPVTPINPRSPSITVLSRTHTTTASPAALTDAPSTSLSVITPPAVTRQLLKEAKEAGIPAIWLQPGSFDKEGLEYARRAFKVVIAGEGGRGGEGWCVLVDGEAGLKAAGREWSRL
ncbi:NAD(P)-binding protein [Lojkania enalia]|uniref:NAD(P)-binding protein n=1 Tax=Lojkania enalia TaxID=147567 RepID=A0A9P4N610_9PLEO|nr:NAD(P)-binding protein [Didymosphaeria enalia]